MFNSLYTKRGLRSVNVPRWSDLQRQIVIRARFPSPGMSPEKILRTKLAVSFAARCVIDNMPCSSTATSAEQYNAVLYTMDRNNRSVSSYGLQKIREEFLGSQGIRKLCRNRLEGIRRIHANGDVLIPWRRLPVLLTELQVSRVGNKAPVFLGSCVGNWY